MPQRLTSQQEVRSSDSVLQSCLGGPSCSGYARKQYLTLNANSMTHLVETTKKALEHDREHALESMHCVRYDGRCLPSRIVTLMMCPAPCRFCRMSRMMSSNSAAGQTAEAEPAASTSGKADVSSNGTGRDTSVLTFQEAIARLQSYWASLGCAVCQPSNSEVCSYLSLHNGPAAACKASFLLPLLLGACSSMTPHMPDRGKSLSLRHTSQCRILS